MEDRNQLPPQPPIYPVTSDISPHSPYHYSPPPSKRPNRGILRGLAAAGAAAALALYGSTDSDVLRLAAWLGFFLTLINPNPVWQLDGAWIVAHVSKWVQLAGYAVVAALALLHFVSIFLIVIAVLGIPTLIQRFRNDADPYYKTVPTRARWALGGAWLALILYLGFALVQTTSLLTAIPR